MNKTITVQIRNSTGELLSVTGKSDDVYDLIKGKDHEPVPVHYFQTRGRLLAISGMNSTHIKNAMSKLEKEWRAEVDIIENPGDYTRKLLEGPLHFKDYHALAKELLTRSTW